jgi:hypothetical protein
VPHFTDLISPPAFRYCSDACCPSNCRVSLRENIAPQLRTRGDELHLQVKRILIVNMNGRVRIPVSHCLIGKQRGAMRVAFPFILSVLLGLNVRGLLCFPLNGAGEWDTVSPSSLGWCQGKISDATSHYLGQGWTGCTPAQEEKITLRHQLTMTSGPDDGVADPYRTIPGPPMDPHGRLTGRFAGPIPPQRPDMDIPGCIAMQPVIREHGRPSLAAGDVPESGRWTDFPRKGGNNGNIFLCPVFRLRKVDRSKEIPGADRCFRVSHRNIFISFVRRGKNNFGKNNYQIACSGIVPDVHGIVGQYYQIA